MSRYILLLLAGSVLSGCAVGPDYKAPSLDLSPSFHAAAPAALGAAPTPAGQSWWSAFNDAELVRIVDRVAEQNLSIAAAKSRLVQARASARAAGAALSPTVDATGSAAKARQSLDGPIGTIGRHLPGFERDIDDDTLGFGANWEIDLFGGLRRERDAARAGAQVSAEDLAAVRVAVEADAADAYLQARALQARIRVADRQLQVQSDLLSLVRQRFVEGVSPERELHQAEASRAEVEAGIPQLKQALDVACNALDVLMGVEAGTYRAELGDTTPAPTLVALPDIGAPGDLLRRRPDLLAAEARLRAANARVGAAVAGYYPRLSLSALLGVDSLHSASLFDSDAQQGQLALGLRWRLFDFGRIDAEVADAKGRNLEALAGYRLAVLQATAEVEDALSAYSQQRARSLALQNQIAALSTARVQIGQAYEEGAASLMEVRDADRTLLSAQDQLVVADAAIARAAVASFRALGGVS